MRLVLPTPFLLDSLWEGSWRQMENRGTGRGAGLRGVHLHPHTAAAGTSGKDQASGRHFGSSHHETAAEGGQSRSLDCGERERGRVGLCVQGQGQAGGCAEEEAGQRSTEMHDTQRTAAGISVQVGLDRLSAGRMSGAAGHHGHACPLGPQHHAQEPLCAGRVLPGPWAASL